MSAKPKVLVTGGAGFIGSHLTERLLRDGKDVVVIDDLSTGRIENLAAQKNNPGLTFIRAKVSEYKELNNLIAQCESVYHLAAAVGVELVIQSCVRSIETNVHETEVILHAVAEHRVPVLLASTSEVYGKSTKPAFSEDDDLLIGPPKFSRWSYACSKLMDEFLALAFAREREVPVVVARLFNTVGPRQTGQYGMVLPRFIASARRGEPLRVYGDGRQTRCFCFVSDTVEALVRLQSTPASRNNVFNVGNPEEVSIVELAKLVIEITNSKSAVEFVPYEQAYAPGFEDMLRRKPVIDRLAEVTGFRPSTPLRKIVELTVASVG
ncbi:MAG: NAD-dependent epimerase/dehydratase [Verrucomicrobiales bacterium]|nr:NAD-dependent epimerase/dehydratase [Verrucomicrobiales bacterium]